jgi:hypothetical protein
MCGHPVDTCRRLVAWAGSDPSVHIRVMFRPRRAARAAPSLTRAETRPDAVRRNSRAWRRHRDHGLVSLVHIWGVRLASCRHRAGPRSSIATSPLSGHGDSAGHWPPRSGWSFCPFAPKADHDASAIEISRMRCCPASPYRRQVPGANDPAASGIINSRCMDLVFVAVGGRMRSGPTSCLVVLSRSCGVGT